MSLSSRTAGFSISTKLNLVLALSVLVVLGGAGAYLSYWLGQKSEARSMAEMDRSNLQVVDMVEAYASVLEHSAESLGAQFSADLPKPLTIDSTEHMVSGKSELPRRQQRACDCHGVHPPWRRFFPGGDLAEKGGR